MGALFLHLKPDEYLKKLYKTKKLVEKTSFSLQAEAPERELFYLMDMCTSLLLNPWLKLDKN
ncbi:hypothetical protein U7118_10800 [Bacillus subtilis]|uniref:hypothetical protein n=1 Tax=Bacillus subtilis TaxID=1423 RepID=UPI00202A65BA|nr:hypothetical protein [Bacillus subtilis]WRK89675.1 hypothetical protein U7118_10800 [Bacillus subtilis]WRS93726.1 hypothetical protein VDS57_21565 [Bacillus subtilis]